MFRSFHRSLLTCALLTVVASTSAFAQSFPNYRMERIDVPHPTNSWASHLNNLGLAVIRWTDPETNLRGVTIYDQLGLLRGNPGESYEIQDLVDVPVGSIDQHSRGFSKDGLDLLGNGIVGGTANGYYADLSVIDPITGKSPITPIPQATTRNLIRAINNDGDIIVQYEKLDGTWDLYWTHRDSLNTFVPLNLPVSDSAIRLNNRLYDNSGNLILNAQIFGRSDNYLNYRYTLGDPNSFEILEDSSGNPIPYLGYYVDINDAGSISGTYFDTVTVPVGKGKKTRTITRKRVARYGSGLEILSDGLNHEGRGMNNSGDVVGFDLDDDEGFLIQDGVGLVYLKDLVVGDDAQFWIDGSTRCLRVTNRGTSGFGQILGLARMTTTTGKGKNRKTIIDERVYLLTPEWP